MNLDLCPNCLRRHPGDVCRDANPSRAWFAAVFIGLVFVTVLAIGAVK